MTRAEAIALFEKQLTAAQVVLDSGFGNNPGENDFLYRRRKEMAEIALSALRPVSREQVEMVLDEWEPCEFCGEWIGGDCTPKEQDVGYKIYAGYIKQVAVDDFWEDEIENLNFCPVCGRPMTDEAVQMVMERLEALHNAD